MSCVCFYSWLLVFDWAELSTQFSKKEEKKQLGQSGVRTSTFEYCLLVPPSSDGDE
jgi:hypothetical protein